VCVVARECYIHIMKMNSRIIELLLIRTECKIEATTLVIGYVLLGTVVLKQINS
jgi:hypothetical protein